MSDAEPIIRPPAHAPRPRPSRPSCRRTGSRASSCTASRPCRDRGPRLVGRAFTMRAVSAREDMLAQDRALPPEVNLQRRAAEECPAGRRCW